MSDEIVESGVTGPETPSGGEELPFPEAAGLPEAVESSSEEPQQVSPEPTQQRENHIPYSRVRQMVGTAEERAYARARQEIQAQLSPFLQQLNPEVMRREIAQEMLRGLGAEPKKEPPRPVTADEVQRMLQEHNQRIEALREQDQRQLGIERETQKATAEMNSAKSKYQEYFSAYPSLEEEIANLWGSEWAHQNGVSISQIADMKVAQLRDAIGKLNQGYAARREEEGRVQPVRPGAGSRPSQKSSPMNDDDARAAAIRFLKGAQR